ncbi:hypothetical protein FACS1894110_09900 [Spirochaetia bacterium]|nr:hypothetical protein FACS1894110_09900 [Spirochaetia bacterium]
MADKNTLGVESLTFDGIQYDLTPNANPNMLKPKITIEAVPTTGKTMYRIIKADSTSDGWPLAVNGEELEILKAQVEAGESKPYSLKMFNGDVYTGTGTISYDQYAPNDGTVNATIVDDGDGPVRFGA